MGAADRRCGIYYDRLTRWQAEGRALRAILLDTPLDEAFKWRQPVYVLGGENVAIFHAMKECCGISFFRGALLNDPEGLLVAPGPNSQAARQFRFTSLDEVERHVAAIRAYVAEAIALHEAGEKVDFTAKRDLALPEELVAALDTDPAFAEAWHALTPGRQRGYVLFISGAKKSETRAGRVEKWREAILAGKGMHD